MTEGRAAKAVLFDVHDTLVLKDYRSSPRAVLNCVEVVRAAGYDIALQDYESAVRKASQMARQDALEMGEVTVEGWYDAILRGLGIRDYSPDLVQRINEAFNLAFATSTRALPQTRRALRCLRRSYSLGIVSNSLAPNTLGDLRVAGILDCFQAIVISSDFGKRKPHPAIFLNALEKMGVAPTEAVFVGDNPYEDIFGAKEVGMRAVLIAHPLVEKARRLRAGIPPLQHVEVCVEPDASIQRLGELIDVLEGWNPKGKVKAMARELTLSGRVVTGVGQATGFTELPWVKALFIERLGVDPYPGTLNIKLEDPADLESWRGVFRQEGIAIPPPNPDFCAAKGFKVMVEDRYAGAIVFPLVPGYPEDTIEIIAPVHLKRSLGIEDGAVISFRISL